MPDLPWASCSGMASRKGRPDLYLGDLRRVILAACDLVDDDLVLHTITAPPVVPDPRAYNRSFNHRLTRLTDAAARRCVRRFDRRPYPILRVTQYQNRGLAHAHIGHRSGPGDLAVNRYWVSVVRELLEEPQYDFGYVFDDGYKLRRGKDGTLRDNVFRDPPVAGRYLAGYFTDSPQLRALLRDGQVNRPVWVNPALTQLSGANMRRLRQVRHGHEYARAREAGSYPRPPAWWGDLPERARTLRLLKSPHLSA